MVSGEQMDNSFLANDPLWDGRINASSPRASMNPDRLISSGVYPNLVNSEVHHRYKIRQSNRLPLWLWSIISSTLGIDESPGKERCKPAFATCLHMLTLLSGIFYGACGFYFNVYDTLSMFTRTTVMVCMAKSVLGLFWILLGIYSHSLAARLFGNPRMVDCIRLHSKTFIKVNMVLIIAVLTTASLVLDFNHSSYLLNNHKINRTSNTIYNSNCASIGVSMLLCQFYFFSKIIYSCLSLCWNLMVAAICLSVCRTLTIGIRQFLRELNIDAQIYEEHQLLLMKFQRQVPASIARLRLDSSWSLWDDDVKRIDEEDEDSNVMPLSNRETCLRRLRTYRCSTSTADNDHERSGSVTRNVSVTEASQDVFEYLGASRDPIVNVRSDSYNSSSDSGHATEMHPELQEDCEEKRQSDNALICLMSNEDLMFTYYKLMRRMLSTSRLLQRWVTCWILFVAMWCFMYLVYWTSHTATVEGLSQFLLPVITIALLTSAYAEVNAEATRLISSVLPTEKRIAVFSYFQKCPLELKIYSFVMSYNVLVTVFAGVALAISSRIILDQFTK